MCVVLPMCPELNIKVEEKKKNIQVELWVDVKKSQVDTWLGSFLGSANCRQEGHLYAEEGRVGKMNMLQSLGCVMSCAKVSVCGGASGRIAEQVPGPMTPVASQGHHSEDSGRKEKRVDSSANYTSPQHTHPAEDPSAPKPEIPPAPTARVGSEPASSPVQRCIRVNVRDVKEKVLSIPKDTPFSPSPGFEIQDSVLEF